MLTKDGGITSSTMTIFMLLFLFLILMLLFPTLFGN